MLLDLTTFKFDKRKIVAASMYIQIGFFYKIFEREMIACPALDIQLFLSEIEQKYTEFSAMIQNFIYT